MFKRICAILLTVILLLSTVSVGVSAVSYSGHSSFMNGPYGQALSALTLTGNQRADIVAVAKTQVGYMESSSTSNLAGTAYANGNCTEYGRWYGMQDQWCAMFVSWCAYIAGVDTSVIQKHAWTVSGLQQFINQGRAYSRSTIQNGGYTPRSGDIVYFKSSSTTEITNHIGIVTGYSNGTLYTIEGNTSSATVSTSGGMVREKSYAISNTYIAYVCCPAYKETYLSTDKTVYITKSGDVEPVMVSASCSASDSWVGIFPASANVATDGSIAWFYCNDGGANPRDIWYSNYDTSVAWPVAAGDYKIVLFGDGGKTNVLKTVNISVVKDTLTTNKNTYCVNNSIYVSTDYYADYAWVGLYESGTTPSSSNSTLYWYYLYEGGTNNTDIFGFHRERPEDYKAGKYDIVLFADEGYNVVNKTTVTVINCTDSATDSDHKCDYCGTDNITSHTYDQKSTASKYLKSAATCAKKAEYYYSCRCGVKGTSTFSAGSSLEHSYNGVVTKQPTCTESGVKTFTCATCGDEYTETFADSNAHKYPETYEGNEDNWAVEEGNCLVESVAHPKCMYCGFTDTSVSYSLGYGEHSMGEIEWDSEATCTDDVHGTSVCEVCWAYEEEHTIPAKGAHTKSDAAYENNAQTGCYDAVVKCSDCGEELTRVVTDIPSETLINPAITQETYVNVSTSVGICTVVSTSQLGSYSSYSVRYAHFGTDANYDFVNSFGENKNFTKYTSSKKYTIYSDIALYQMNLPVSVTVCVYDENGNLVAVSNPYVTTITEEMWLLYNKEDATEKNLTAYVDVVNMGSSAQKYFANQGTESKGSACDLSFITLPNEAYAFDLEKATPSVPKFDLSSMPNSITPNVGVSVGGKTCEFSVAVNMSGGAPAVSYMIKRGASVSDPSLWSMEIEYTDAQNVLQSKTVSGMYNAVTNPDGFMKSGTYAYYNFAPALYDTNKTVTANIYYGGTLVCTSSYSIETYIAASFAENSEGIMAEALSDIAKFGQSIRANFGYN